LTAKSKEEIVAEGKEAMDLLQSPIFRAAVLQTQESISERWVLADTTAKREDLHAQRSALELVVEELMTFANNGKQTQYAIDAENNRRGPGTSQRQGA